MNSLLAICVCEMIHRTRGTKPNLSDLASDKTKRPASTTVGEHTWIMVSKYVADVGNGTSTSIVITHGLGTRDLQVDLYDVTTGETVDCDVVRTSTSAVTLGFATAPASNSLRVVVQG